MKSTSGRAIPRFRLMPPALKAVAFKGGFWAGRIETNRRVTLPLVYRRCKETGRLDAWKLEWKAGQPNRPHIFWDSDVAKWIEAAAYSLATHPDRHLESLVDGVVDWMARAQAKDGYLNSHYLAVEPEKRWTNLRDCHELYCAGHLMEAAVAYAEATGKRKMLDVLCRYADHIDSVFGREKGKKRGYCGHEEIELALVKLHRATGDTRYLKLAAYFIDERGRRPHYYDLEARARGQVPLPTYDQYQAQRPVRDLVTLDGHAVRAFYLCSGMADVAAESGDAALLAVCKRLWRNAIERRLYITGGVGSAHAGERFTFDYDLPNESAYAETCAAIALVFFAQRMARIEADAQYVDVMERALYNGVLSGVSLDGRRFFYVNPLASDPGSIRYQSAVAGHKRWVSGRQPWFGTSCCPTNIVRLLAGFGNTVYSQGADEIAVQLYAQSTARFNVNGQILHLEQVTDYPWTEAVRLKVTASMPVECALALRMPGWCRNPHLAVNGKAVRLPAVTRKGYARIRRWWRTGDRVDLFFPMPVERVEAHPAVRTNCGQVALQRGPLVYCLEEVDNGPHLSDIRLPRHSRLKAAFDPRFLSGAVVITGQALRRDPAGWSGRLYRADRSGTRPVTIKAIPYFLWSNRAPGEMRVWIRE